MKVNILVIDDEESIRFSFHRFLNAEGYNVITAETYHEALSRMDETTFDMILTDIILEDGSGIDILQEVIWRMLKTRVIIMTAYPSRQTYDDSFRMNAADYLVKPLRQKKLLHSVNRLFHNIKDEEAHCKTNIPQNGLILQKKGDTMKKIFKSEDIEDIMTRADTLLKQFDTEMVKDMEEVHRAQIEKEVYHLNKLKMEFQGKNRKADNQEDHSYGDGMHAAIEDISKAMKALARYLT